MRPSQIRAALEPLLLGVQKPARYVGGELNQVLKDWSTVSVRTVLAFPDIYDIGLPNLGLAILYDLINQRPELLAERVYVPWTDMEQALRAAGVPLFSLESKHALGDFDVLGLSLPYETLYTNALNLLDLAGLPLRTADRTPEHPLVIAGGHTTFNPEPMAAFVDASLIGDGEEVLLEVLERVGAWKAAGGGSREALLRQLAAVDGVYVPSLYRPVFGVNGTLEAMEPLAAEARPQVRKRIVAELPPPPTHFIVPHLEVVHDRAVVEVMRGCSRGCRFCQAGMITRPVRERPLEQVVEAVAAALDATGFSEVGLRSLSSSDYSQVLELVQTMGERFAGRELNISLPSLRIESFSVELMQALSGGGRRGGFTLAPEAASPRMQRAINKVVAAEEVLRTADEVFSRGWHTIKLYLMLGHPGETLEDVEAIAELVQQVAAAGRKRVGGRARVNVGVSTFVPKPHTPFQWEALAPADEIAERQALLKKRLRSSTVKLSWNDTNETLLEACLSRGDRRLGDVIEAAWRRGARFDAWQELRCIDHWLKAFAEVGLDPAFYAHRRRSLDEVLPWDHIRAVDRRFLVEERRRSVEGELTADCREQCHACGILPDFKVERAAHPGPGWKCPEVSGQ